MDYGKPVISEYGDMTDLTAASLNPGPEDGADKNVTIAHHSTA